MTLQRHLIINRNPVARYLLKLSITDSPWICHSGSRAFNDVAHLMSRQAYDRDRKAHDRLKPFAVKSEPAPVMAATELGSNLALEPISKAFHPVFGVV